MKKIPAVDIVEHDEAGYCIDGGKRNFILTPASGRWSESQAYDLAKELGFDVPGMDAW